MQVRRVAEAASEAEAQKPTESVGSGVPGACQAGSKTGGVNDVSPESTAVDAASKSTAEGKGYVLRSVFILFFILYFSRFGGLFDFASRRAAHTVC